jgi:hypothetical protein
MLLKQLLVSAFLGCALLMFGISLKKLIYGVIGLIAEILLSFLSPIACFAFFVVAMFLMLMLGDAQSAPRIAYRITAIDGPLQGRQFELSDKQRKLTFGIENSDVLLPSYTTGVSRHHCHLELNQNGEPVLTDDHSRNGTFLMFPAPEKVAPGIPVQLREGAIFCLARKDVLFQINKISK